MSGDNFLSDLQGSLLKIKLGLDKRGHLRESQRVQEMMFELDDLIGTLIGERLKKWQEDADKFVQDMKKECRLLEKFRDDLNKTMEIADKIVDALAAAEKVVKSLAKYV